MKFATVRDFRANTSKLFNELEKQKEVIVTKRGKPIAILLPLSEEEFFNVLRLIRQIHFRLAMEETRKDAKAKGLDKISMEEINAEIRAARQTRKSKNSTRH